MKKWYHIMMIAALMTAAYAVPAGAVTADPAADIKHLESYYIVKGSTYDEIHDLLASLPTDVTGMNETTYFRINKNLVSKYFYDVSLYDGSSRERQSHFFVAKDKSSVWQLKDGEETSLVYGNGEELLKKTEVVVYPTRIPLGSYGIIRVQIPGHIPYDIKVTSLNSSVASISEKMNIIPVQEGKTDIVIDLKVGNATKTFSQTINIIDTADKDVNRGSRAPSIGIGIGVGWGGGWHHHGGGIGIGMGPWW